MLFIKSTSMLKQFAQRVLRNRCSFFLHPQLICRILANTKDLFVSNLLPRKSLVKLRISSRKKRERILIVELFVCLLTFICRSDCFIENYCAKCYLVRQEPNNFMYDFIKTKELTDQDILQVISKKFSRIPLK